MFNFVQNWLGPNNRPIGVDFGSDCLRMAQVQIHDGQPRLIAAAHADVPASSQEDSEARAKFFVTAARNLLAAGNFSGRQVLLGLPAAITSVACITLPPLDENERKRAIAAEVGEKHGIDADEAIIRNLVVGEPDVEMTTPRQFVAVVASKVEVNRLLAAAEQAHLEVFGMNIEPKALIDCFSHVYLRRSDATTTMCFVDIGASGTRMAVVRGGHILGVGTIAIGGSDFTRAVASAMSVSFEDAKLERLKISHADTQSEELRDKRELFTARPISASLEIARQREMINTATADLVQGLIRQLERFFENVAQQSPTKPIDRLVFVGGEAQNRRLCRSIASGLGVSAVVGDPLLRMGRLSNLGFESGIDRREPQPSWAVAIGLSLGAPVLPKRGGDRQRPEPCPTPRLVNRAETIR